MELKIEQNIPLPVININTGRAMSDETRVALKMKPGDSVLCPTAKIYKRIVTALRNRKLSYASRRVEGGYRVWRTDGRRTTKTAVSTLTFKKNDRYVNGEARA